MRLYFDACCLHRPLDDQVQERIRIESEAVRLLLAKCALGVHRRLCSEAVWDEVLRNPDEDKKLFVRAMLQFADEMIRIDEQMRMMARNYST